MNGIVYALAVNASGTLFAGGDFTMADGVTVNRVTQWSGSAWSAMGTGAFELIRALVADGDLLYLGGRAGSVSGVAINYVGRWNGTIWSALTGGGVSGPVDALAVDGGGNLHAVGFFASAGGGVPCYETATWDGAGWSNLGSGVAGSVSLSEVYAVAVDPTGQLYVGGSFNRMGDKSSDNFAIWRMPVITTSAGAHGSISPSGGVPVRRGGNRTFTITPEVAYHVQDVLVPRPQVGEFEVATGGQGARHLRGVLLRRLEAQAVQLHEHARHRKRDALVAIRERVVLGEGVRGREPKQVRALVGEEVPRTRKGRLQQALIEKSRCTSVLR